MKTVPLFQTQFDAIRMPEAVDQLWRWIATEEATCQYVVTPNVDHAVMLSESPQLREVYAAAGLVLADGWPVVTASRWLGRPIPERVAGSDLVPHLFASARGDRPVSVFLLGGMPGVAERAAQRIHERWSHVHVAGTDSPPLGFEHDAAENDRIVAKINETDADVLVVGLGAPKQELWVHRHRDRLQVNVALCVGATIDFLAGEKRRAPKWAQALRMEWLHRLLCEPRRLARRYAKDAWIFPQLVWQEWWSGASRVAR